MSLPVFSSNFLLFHQTIANNFLLHQGVLMSFSYQTGEYEEGRLLAFRHEWLETNGLGGYASSSLLGCNTRKYHGLFVVNLPHQADRHVLLSTLEEHLECGGAPLPLSSRQHPDVLYPNGHEYIVNVATWPCPETTYRHGDMLISRSLLFLHGTNTLLIRYACANVPPEATLTITPLLAYRSVHRLTHENSAPEAEISLVPGGMSVRPSSSLPALFIQGCPSFTSLAVNRDWCRNIYYATENERGFPAYEDLFMPGQLTLSPCAAKTFYLVVGLEPFPFSPLSPAATIEGLWTAEIDRRRQSPPIGATGLETRLARAAETFIVRQPHVGTSVLAGYHWFNAWGRDTFIALPGLCFCTDNHTLGQKILMETRTHARGGLVPNILSPDGNHAYNSVDASLWYLWAVHQMALLVPGSINVIRETLWEFLKEIVFAYLKQSGKQAPWRLPPGIGPENGHAPLSSPHHKPIAQTNIPYTSVDEHGFLHVGTPQTQLTWMDAMAYGKAVTPRNGYPVELNSLWYNGLCFLNHLAEEFGEPPIFPPSLLDAMPGKFLEKFWVPTTEGGYLADVWHPASPSLQIRPNQIFAVSLPYPLVNDQPKARHIVHTVTQHLLTPYGLRTLSPTDSAYCPLYEGGPDQRDSAYHQGTVWPWLLGAYTDALLKTSENKKLSSQTLLETITPLLFDHIDQAGVGSISEIFDAEPPYRPNGCISQAWSVAEILRLIATMDHHCSGIFQKYARKRYGESL